MYFYKGGKVLTSNWVGIVHDPENTHDYYKQRNLYKNEVFLKSLPFCKGLFCMSKGLIEHTKNVLKPMFFVDFLYHPVPSVKTNNWNMEKWKLERNVYQIGNWLRNPYMIFKVKIPGFQKKLIPFEKRLQTELDYFLKLDNAKLTDEETKTVQKLAKISDEEYVDMFDRIIVFLNLYSSTCNNVILECIHHNTPLIINRLPAIEEYLGVNYPLFYEKTEQLDTMLTDENILNAHIHLQNIDKTKFSLDLFLNSVQSKLVPSV